MSCPIGAERLARYWLGDLDAAEAAEVEEHIFDCDACQAESARFEAIAGGVLHLETIRRLPPAVTAAEVAALERAGYSVEETVIRTGEPGFVSYPRGLDIMILRLVVPESAAPGYRLEIVAGGGPPVVVDDVPVADGALLLACRSHYLDDFPPDLRFRVLAAGDGALIAEYRVDHVRSEASAR